MATKENEDNFPDTSSDEIDMDRLKDVIREVVLEMSESDDDGDDEEIETPSVGSKRSSNKDQEDEIRRLVEEAMVNLQSQKSQQARVKTRQSTARKVEPEEIPTPPKKKVNIGNLLWGSQDAGK
jgi:hypothetical protein